MTESTSPGRPRDPGVDARVLDAALDVVAEFGYDRASIEKIAAHAGVGRPSVYRRWPTKRDLVLDAMRARVATRTTPDDQGSLRADMVALLTADQEALRARGGFAIGVVAGLSSDPLLANEFRRMTAATARHSMQTAIDRAVARGELPVGFPADEWVFELAQALLIGRCILVTEDGDAGYIARCVDDVLLRLITGG